ncbi:hypothetical protein CDAR_555891 [Caerostris darwini]|uniref:Uncharacterized protein n=1 Tax=Caerostris darwini TaxID=1538125 RepID=A0AAV4NAF3_9ARAC|nr:hypothetical protein CDAR_555891 [Caerostris darwini]
MVMAVSALFAHSLNPQPITYQKRGEIDLLPISCPDDYGPIPLKHSLRRDTWIEFEELAVRLNETISGDYGCKSRAIKINSTPTISYASRRPLRNEQQFHFTKRPPITILWLDYPNGNSSVRSLCSFAEPATNHLPGEVCEIDLPPISCPSDYGPIPLEHSLRRDTWIEF